MIKIRLLPACLFVVVAALVINSCGDDDNPTGSGLVSQLPNQVGMLWVYEVYDSLTQKTDTVQVSITDTALSIGQGLLWRTRWHSNGFVTENIATLSGDTLDFIIDTTFIAPPLERFVFPLTLGSQWDISQNFPGFDSSEVTEIGTVNVPAGQFSRSALIERMHNDFFEGGYDSSQTWIAPIAGIVKRYFRTIGTDGGGNFFVTKNQTWELIDYDLSTFSMKQFPGTIGNEWVYELIDSRFSVPDTVTISVIDKLQIEGVDSVKVWLMEGKMVNDTQFVSYLNNQIIISQDSIYYFPISWSYLFPLAVGRNWGGVGSFNFSYITTKEEITAPVGKFPSAFHFSISVINFNLFWRVDDWLVPGVGVVKREYSESDFGPGYSQEWNLLSYKLK